MIQKQALFILGLIFAILVTIFALSNANVVVIQLFLYKFQASQALVIFFSAALGAIIVTLLGTFSHFKMKFELMKLRKENEQLTEKTEALSKELEAAAKARMAELSRPENLSE